MIKVVRVCQCDRCDRELSIDQNRSRPAGWTEEGGILLCKACSDKYSELKKGFLMGRDFKFTTDAGTARLMRD